MTEKEFELLFREQFTPLCNLAYTVVKDAEVARDITQQVFLNYWQLRGKSVLRGPVKGYLYKAVVNTSLNHLAKNRRMTRFNNNIPEIIEENTDETYNSYLLRHVHLIIDELPPVCKKVFILSRFSNLTNKEVSIEMDISVKAVEKHISKALKILRFKLKPLMNTELILYLQIYAAGNILFSVMVGYFKITLSI
ncbi:MAG: RNA polymerase sigma-70 factor [Bacteroidales bacterium]